jgi:hypothetical protein
MRRFILSGLCIVTLPTAAYAQAREVAGKVQEATTGRPIPDAAVMVAGQDVGACTDERGVYRLQVPAGAVSVIVRAVAFEPGIVRLDARDSTADFALKRDVRSPSAQPIQIVGAVPVSSTASNQPIFLIDGIPLSNEPNGCREGRLIRE